MEPAPLTVAQQELYDWIVEFLAHHGHAPSIRQMMEAMGLRSPAPIQSRLRYLQKKGWIRWQPGRARTLQLTVIPPTGIPVLGTVSAGGLVETFPDVEQHLDLQTFLKGKSLFALTVCGDSMIGTHITNRDMVVMKPVTDIRDPTQRSRCLRHGPRGGGHSQTLLRGRRHHPSGAGKPCLQGHCSAGGAGGDSGQVGGGLAPGSWGCRRAIGIL